MRTLLGKSLFSVGDTEYRWEDALIGAGLRKEWPAIRRPTDQGLALERAVSADDAELAEEVEAAAEEFRHARGLLSADDLERWLDERGLSIERWLGHLRRGRLRERAAERSRSVRKTAPDQVRDPLHADLVCSGSADRLARELAGRAAGAAAAGGPKARWASKQDPLPRDLVAVLAMNPDVCAQRAAQIAALDEPYARFVSQATSPDRLARAIDIHRADWTRVRLRRVRLDDVDQAKELVLLVRQDGLAFPDAARRAGAAIEEKRLFCEDVDPLIRDRVLGARRGEVIGPVAAEDGVLVCEIVDRVEPRGREKAVAARATEAALRAAIDREVASRVTWLERSLLTTRA